MRNRLLFVLAISLVGCSVVTPPEKPVGRPNIIFFLVDDMGWQDTSVPFWTERTPFNEHFRTPNMERLAATGVRFAQAYACAVCSPTRTSLMTGHNAVRHHVTNWTLHDGKDQSGKTKRLQSPRGWRIAGLQPDETTLSALLQAAGYRTIHAGKAHWGAHGTPGADPCRLGFDVNIAGHPSGAPASYTGRDSFGGKKLEKNGKPGVWAVPGLEKYHGLDVNLSDALTIEANAAVESAVRDGQPFYLYMAHYAVHTPLRPHASFVERYRKAGIDEKESRYASMVEGMDQSLGSILQTLRRLGVAKETIILFASDNGGLSAVARGRTPRGTGKDTHNWPLKAGKGSAYEGGTRIPQIVSWAERASDHPLQSAIPVDEGVVRQTPTLIEDAFPTLLRWAGLEVPEGHICDGRDMTPILSGEPGASDRPFLFHYPHVWGPRGLGYEPHSAMRLGRYKAIYFYQPQRWELYDLEADLGEAKDLASEQPARMRDLAARMMREMAATGAQWPTDRVSGAPEPPVLPGS